MNEILSREDYIDFVAELHHNSEARNLLEFIGHMIDYHAFSNQGSVNVDLK